eukprot:scaffold76329_cov41-Cyclotella_meneghiniana.AAC.1
MGHTVMVANSESDSYTKLNYQGPHCAYRADSGADYVAQVLLRLLEVVGRLAALSWPLDSCACVSFPPFIANQRYNCTVERYNCTVERYTAVHSGTDRYRAVRLYR